MENGKHSLNRSAKKTKLKKVVKSIDLGLRKKSEDDEISSKYAFLKDKDMSAPKSKYQELKDLIQINLEAKPQQRIRTKTIRLARKRK